MIPTPRARACMVLLFWLVSACGGSSTPEPSAADEQAKRDRAEREKADEEKAKTSRLARLQGDDSVEPMPESVVTVTFEPLVTGVRPGRKFLLAARFKITKGFRISWSNAGDVGKDTVVEFRGPAGFEVGRVAFPVPERYTVSGGYVGYGYQNETAVFVEVKAPASLGRGGVHRFDLSASWVACKKECATERTDAFIELATTYGSAAAKDTEASLAPFKERLPKPLAEMKDAQQKWESTGRGATLVVNVPGAEAREFWPGEKAEPAPKKVAVSGSELRFVFGEKPGPDARPLRGLVVASAEGHDAFFDLEATSPDKEDHGTKRGQVTKGRRRR